MSTPAQINEVVRVWLAGGAKLPAHLAPPPQQPDQQPDQQPQQPAHQPAHQQPAEPAADQPAKKPPPKKRGRKSTAQKAQVVGGSKDIGAMLGGQRREPVGEEDRITNYFNEHRGEFINLDMVDYKEVGTVSIQVHSAEQVQSLCERFFPQGWGREAKRKSARFSAEQKEILEQAFDEQPRVSDSEVQKRFERRFGKTDRTLVLKE